MLSGERKWRRHQRIKHQKQHHGSGENEKRGNKSA